ncbi:hypothetical protein PAV_1c13100 [Paenibacillus alvei DSM 29]|nr:hypothetical protein PAV_1c13100 [Paenibacillus alvei DSM 29]
MVLYHDTFDGSIRRRIPSACSLCVSLRTITSLRVLMMEMDSTSFILLCRLDLSESFEFSHL